MTDKPAEVEQAIRRVFTHHENAPRRAGENKLDRIVSELLPVISRLLDAAHADALRAMAEHPQPGIHIYKNNP